MARDLQRELIKKARTGVIDTEKGTRALAREVKKVVGGNHGLDYNEDPPYCRTALFEATWRNHESIVKDLINQGAQVDLPDAQGSSPLHEAAYYGYLPLVELLLDNKADINRQDKKGQTPLFRAVQGTSTKTFGGSDRNVDVVMFLINAKAECNITDSDGCTIQHLACFNGDPEMSWWLFHQRAWKNRFSREDLPNGLPPKVEEVNAEE
jgi:ankyrin repeat protein